MESTSVQGMAAGFVALAIMLSIGTLILGGSIASCDIQGYTTESEIPDEVDYTRTLANGTVRILTTDEVYWQAGVGRSGASPDQLQADLYADPPQLNNEWTIYEYERGTWAAQCYKNNQQAQAGYNLLIIALIVMAAAVIMVVVRHLSG